MIKKAIIPIAGQGTRMYPAAKAFGKEMLPVVTPEGVCQPALLSILQEAFSAGCQEVALLCNRVNAQDIPRLFQPCADAIYAKLSPQQKKQEDFLRSCQERVTILLAPEPLGLGYAVSCAAEWCGKEPALLLLGDHLYLSDSEISCSRQVAETFEKYGEKTTVGLSRLPIQAVPHYGTACGNWLQTGEALSITEMQEKPTVAYAREHLLMAGYPDSALCVYGVYALGTAVFNLLQQEIQENHREKGEFQLTTVLGALATKNELNGCLIHGTRLDLGQPDVYLKSLQIYRSGRI